MQLLVYYIDAFNILAIFFCMFLLIPALISILFSSFARVFFFTPSILCIFALLPTFLHSLLYFFLPVVAFPSCSFFVVLSSFLLLQSFIPLDPSFIGLPSFTPNSASLSISFSLSYIFLDSHTSAVLLLSLIVLVLIILFLWSFRSSP